MISYNNFKELTKNRINWECWDRLVAKTRQDIAETLKNYKAPKKQVKYEKCYLYDKDGELVKEFDSKHQCDLYLGGCRSTIHNYINRQWIYKGYLLTCEKLSKNVAKGLYSDRLEHGQVYSKYETKKRIPIYLYDEHGKLVAAYSSKYQYKKQYGNSRVYTLNKSDSIINGRLTSFNKYDEETARRIYSKKAK